MKLIQKDTDLFIFDSGTAAYEGKLHQVITYMHEEAGIPHDEIEFGLVELQRRGHDTAHFGLFQGVFLYSTRSHATAHVVAELRAIASLRLEFSEAYQRDLRSDETKLTWDRLMNLYMSLNVHAALEALGARAEDLENAA